MPNQHSPMDGAITQAYIDRWFISSAFTFVVARKMKLSPCSWLIGALCGATLFTLGACKLAGPDDAEVLAVRGPLTLLSVAPVQGNWLWTTNPPDSLRTGVLPHIVSGGVGGHISGNASWWNVLESGEISFDVGQRFRLRLRYKTFAKGEWTPECRGTTEGEYEFSEDRLVLRLGDEETFGSVFADSNLVSIESLLVNGCRSWNLRWRMRHGRFVRNAP